MTLSAALNQEPDPHLGDEDETQTKTTKTRKTSALGAPTNLWAGSRCLGMGRAMPWGPSTLLTECPSTSD